MTDVYLGIDLGTTSVKVLALDGAGRELARGEASGRLRRPSRERAELDAAEARGDLHSAMTAAMSGLRSDATVRAVGFSCAMHGIMPVDAAGAPLGPIATWLDRRAAEVADRWRADGTARALYHATGAPVHPMLPSCKIAWFAEHEPELHRAAARWVSLKDWLVYELCGEWLADPGVASGTGFFALPARAWSADALSLARIAPGRLPAVASTRTRRRVRDAAAAALGLQRGVELVLGSSDGALANLGTGATQPGVWALTLGTSGALRATTADATFDPDGRTFCYAADDSRYVVGGATSSAGAVVSALADLLFPDVARADRVTRFIAAAAESPAHGLPVVVPFLAGERAPYWRSDLRGAIEGLELDTGRDRIARATVESALFALADVGDVMRGLVGRPTSLRGTGHLATAPAVRELVATLFDCELLVSPRGDGSARGAAWTAAAALDAASAGDLAATVEPAERTTPNRNDHGAAERFARYRAAVARAVAAPQA